MLRAAARRRAAATTQKWTAPKPHELQRSFASFFNTWKVPLGVACIGVPIVLHVRFLRIAVINRGKHFRGKEAIICRKKNVKKVKTKQ
jgi:hypothetical protein